MHLIVGAKWKPLSNSNFPALRQEKAAGKLSIFKEIRLVGKTAWKLKNFRLMWKKRLFKTIPLPILT